MLKTKREVNPTEFVFNCFTSGIDYFLPGLGLQHSVMRVEVLTDHKEDHGHCEDPQHGHVASRQQRGAGQDG